MAVYRIHRKEWDRGHPPIVSVDTGKRRKHSSSSAAVGDVEADSGIEDDAETSSLKSTKPKGRSKSSKDKPKEFPGGGRKGVSSGLSTVVKRSHSSGSSGASSKKSAWWKELGQGPGGTKGSMRMKVG